MDLSTKTDLAAVVQAVDLANPPAGLAVLRAPAELGKLLDRNIAAAILLPKNPVASAFLCDRLEYALEACVPSPSNLKSHTDSYVKFDIDYRLPRLNGHGATPYRSATPLQHPAFASQPLWQEAAAEITAVTDRLAQLFLANGNAPYLDLHVARWTDARDSGQLHTDRGWQLTATQCEAPTIIEIDGHEFQGPDYCITLFKGNRVRHRADLRHPVSPARPRSQLCWDVGQPVIEKFLR